MAKTPPKKSPAKSKPKAKPPARTPAKPARKSTDELPMEELDKVSGGMASRRAMETECTTGLLSTCKVKATSIDSWCPCRS